MQAGGVTRSVSRVQLLEDLPGLEEGRSPAAPGGAARSRRGRGPWGGRRPGGRGRRSAARGVEGPRSGQPRPSLGAEEEVGRREEVRNRSRLAVQPAYQGREDGRESVRRSPTENPSPAGPSPRLRAEGPQGGDGGDAPRSPGLRLHLDFGGEARSLERRSGAEAPPGQVLVASAGRRRGGCGRAVGDQQQRRVPARNPRPGGSTGRRGAGRGMGRLCGERADPASSFRKRAIWRRSGSLAVESRRGPETGPGSGRLDDEWRASSSLMTAGQEGGSWIQRPASRFESRGSEKRTARRSGHPGSRAHPFLSISNSLAGAQGGCGVAPLSRPWPAQLSLVSVTRRS